MRLFSSKIRALSLLAASVFILAQPAFASGGVSCKSLDDKSFAMYINVTSAGSDVRDLKINGKTLIRGKDFEAEAIYHGSRSFNVSILDGERNHQVVIMETVRDMGLAAGLVWINGSDESKIVTCGYLY